VMQNAKKGFRYVIGRIDESEITGLAAVKLWIDFSKQPEGPGGSGLLLMLYGLQGQRLPPAAVRLAAKVGGSRIRPTRFRITRPRFQDRLMSPLPDSPPTEIRANESRHREDAGRLPRNRWFEACSLQRRVCCEPLHGATSVRTQSSSHRRSFRRVAAGSDPA
jgi:hypothetical protein